MKINLALILMSLGLYLGLLSFHPRKNESLSRIASFQPKAKLSDYGFFKGALADQKPVSSVIPYGLNSPLFSDYARKLRFVQVPKGQKVNYHPEEVLDFPDGTFIIKTFYYPLDARRPDAGRRIIETRLLVKDGEAWQAWPYVWDEDQNDAYLEVAGDQKSISWKNEKGKKIKSDYIIPNMNQCKGCHNRDEKIQPIGPSARQLNGDFDYAQGTANQLEKWEHLGILEGLPEDHRNIPQLAVWDVPSSGSLSDRARAYLDINCGHCHHPKGPAHTSGLYLHYQESNQTALGLNKPPIAAGRGSGGRLYDIVPGKPDASILVYRMESQDPGVMMPELSRRLIHKEGVALIKEWIASLD